MIMLYCSIMGCGSAWRGRIVHLADGKVVIQPQGEGEIKRGDKLLIYREKTITHPVTDQVLDTIKDDIIETSVLRVRGRTITAAVKEPWFSMMMVDDQVKSIGGSVDTPAGFIQKMGAIREVDSAQKSVEVNIAMREGLLSGATLTVIKYTEIVFDLDTGEPLAVAMKPVASLQITEIDKILRASYELVDEKLGWIERDDTVVKLTGNMLTEQLWFHDPPDGFSQAWIFRRHYLRAIRHYDAGNFREAILELSDVARIDQGYRDTSYLMGLCYTNLNRHDDAAKRFEILLKQKPNDAKVWAALAYAYLKQEKLQEASEAYEKLADLLPGNPHVWIDAGDVYRAAGHDQKAKQSYEKALKIDETNAEALYELRAK